MVKISNNCRVVTAENAKNNKTFCPVLQDILSCSNKTFCPVLQDILSCSYIIKEIGVKTKKSISREILYVFALRFACPKNVFDRFAFFGQHYTPCPRTPGPSLHQKYNHTLPHYGGVVKNDDNNSDKSKNKNKPVNKIGPTPCPHKGGVA